MVTIVDVLGSDITRNIIGAIAGVTAFLIYNFNKNDQKKRAAMILYLEIQDIENNVNQIKQSVGNNRIDIQIITTNSWQEYKNYFVEKLTRSEYETINSFYSLSELIEHERKVLERLVLQGGEAKAKKLQEVLIELAKDNINDPSKYNSEKDKLLSISHPETYMFEIANPRTNYNKYLNMFIKISISSVGAKLAKIAKAG
jgi:hypothetical protein